MTSSEKVTIDAAVQDARMHLLRFLEDRRHKASVRCHSPVIAPLRHCLAVLTRSVLLCSFSRTCQSCTRLSTLLC